MCLPLHYFIPRIHRTYRENCLYRKRELHRSQKKISFYYKNGQVKTVIHFKNQKLHGPYIQYFSNGSIEKLVHYSKGVKHGKMFHSYGTQSYALKQTGSFHQGRRNGTFYNYSAKGELESIKNYNGGEQHGKQYKFYSSGSFQAEEMFRYGIQNGNSYYFDEPQNVLSQIYYMRGEKVFENNQAMEKEECSICFEETNFKTVCNHPICIECKDQVIACPLCRRHLF